jgi:hypothetical protein
VEMRVWRAWEKELSFGGMIQRDAPGMLDNMNKWVFQGAVYRTKRSCDCIQEYCVTENDDVGMMAIWRRCIARAR